MTTGNNLARANDIVFAELDRLSSLDLANAEQVEAELGRAKAIKDLAGTVIANGNLVLRAAQAQEGTADAIQIPKMLIGY